MPTDASLSDLPSATSMHLEVGDVRLHVVEAGPADGPLVVVLHGFPDFWYGWRRQLPALVDAGYRVLAPDQRGYNLSEKPPGLAAYALDRLSGDVAGLIEAAGRETAHVVGHDWGAAVAWDLALRRPAVVDRLVIVNGPHPAAYRAVLASNPRQWLRSWYVLFFQLPRVPEWALARSDAAALARGLRASANPGAFTDAEVARYREAWRQDGAVRAMLAWYRAAARRPSGPRPREVVQPPTLLAWGERDVALVPDLADVSVTYCADARLATFPDASHWVHLEEPERVNELVLAHLS